MAKKLTNEEFIERAIKIHGNKYNYSNVEYISNGLKIMLECKKHGIFEQIAFVHLNGSGCRKCYEESITSNKDEFIEKAIKIHGNKYNYDNIVYVNSHTNISIECEEENHGIFQQKPYHHLDGEGCPKCGKCEKLTTEIFIKRAREIHGDLYNYDQVKYIHTDFKVKIGCIIDETHGIFEQAPHNHLRGQGCPKCGGTQLINTEEFIKRAREIHGDLYNYDQVKYINSNNYILINCKEHGLFKQKPPYHLCGQGCPHCNVSVGELQIMKFLKDNNIIFISQYSFDDLKYIKLLYFDIAIFDKNGKLLCLIEYNGIQHYVYNEFYHKTLEGFELHKYKDKLKIDYTISHEIPLFIIRYDEDIIKRMKEILSFI